MNSVDLPMTQDARPLIVHLIYRLGMGGLENGVVNLINHLPRDRYRHAIVCISESTDFCKRIKTPGVAVIELHKRAGKDLGYYWRLWRVLRQLRPQIVHSRNLAALDSQLIAWLAAVPCRIHGEHGWDTVDLHGTNKKYLRLRKFMRNFIHLYIPMSQDLQRWLQHSVAVKVQQLKQIYNGVDLSRFQLVDQTRGEPTVFGTVGRLHPVKDQMTLLKAFAALRALCDENQFARLRLLIIGDGPARKDLETLCADLELQSTVEFAGASDDVAAQLQRMQVFVLPSLNEGISNTILEAMATGLPVIATHVGGNPELVMHEKNGYLVPVADAEALARAMYQYIQDPALGSVHGAAGRHLVETRFGLASMLTNYSAAYDALLNNVR